MRPPEWLAVKREQRLQSLLNRLLAVEQGVLDERRGSREVDLRGSQVRLRAP